MAVENDRLHLDQIVNLSDLVLRHLGDYDGDRFLVDRDAIDCTAYRLLSIGEAARRLSDETRLANPDIDWRSVIALRNLLAHDYFVIVPERLWLIYTESLADLAARARDILQAMPPERE